MKTYNQQSSVSNWTYILIMVAAPLFSLFFYQQNFGLNLFLFSILVVALLIISKSKLFQKKEILLKTSAYLITGFAIYIQHSNLVIIANILAFFTLVGSFSDDKSSIYINWINGVYTSSVAAFTLYFERLYSESKTIEKKKINYLYWLKLIGFPLVIVLIFTNLYRYGNPKFDTLISNIDFSFIDFGWLVFTGLGYFLLYNVTNPVTIEPVTSIDVAIKNDLLQKDLAIAIDKKLKNEIQLGIILLVSLNILIALFLVTDVLYLTELHQMSAPELSKQVHTGVNALIVSNLLAIAIILYFFRGSLNFVKENTNLKRLTFAWIFLNLLMIGITTTKNTEYLISFGLTYKRIGVLFFLLCTAIG